MIVIRLAFYFFLSFAILCIPFSDQTLFHFLHKKTAPIAKSIYQAATGFGNKSIKAGKSYGQKLFSNSSPEITDSVKSTSASTTEKEPGPQDHYSDEERAMIRKLTRE